MPQQSPYPHIFELRDRTVYMMSHPTDAPATEIESEPDLDSPRVTQFPLVAVLGDGPTATVINTLLKSRRSIRLSELEDTTGYERDAIRHALSKLQVINAVVEQKPGMYTVAHDSEVIRSFAELERELLVKLHPDSYFAQIVTEEQ